MRRSPFRRLAALTAAIVLLTAPAAVPQQGLWVSYEVVAAADGMRVATVMPGGPLSDQVFDGGAPRAHALLDRLGTSTSYAAGAYPDELVLNVPGLASGITGAPVPAYPLIATSSYPTRPEDELSGPGVELQGNSEEHRSASSAQTGTQAAGHVVSSAVVERTEDVLLAEAEAVAESVVIGPLTIGRVYSSAQATQSPGSDVEHASTLVVSGAQVGEQAVDLTDEDDPGLDVLAEQGVSVQVLAEQETPAGVIAPGLEITVTAPVSLTGDGESTVTYSFGRAVASIDAVAGQSPDAEGAPSLGDEMVADPAPAPAEGSADAPPPPPAPSDTGVAAPPAPVQPEGAMDDDPDALAAAPEVAAVDPPASLGASPASSPVAPVAEEWFMRFYLVLVLSAGLAAASATAFRQWGVRRLWGS